MPTVDEVKFSALGVGAHHLQDVVQVDYAQRLYQSREDALEALNALATVIDKAGVENLMRGVQLGNLSWMAKCSRAMERAKEVLNANPRD